LGNADKACSEDMTFEKAVGDANIPTLLMVLVQLTGDDRWIRPPYNVQKGKGLEDNDTGGLSDTLQREVRSAAASALNAWKNGKAIAMPNPTRSMLVRMLEAAMGEPIPDSYGEIVSATLTDSANLKANPPIPTNFKAVIVGAGVSGICAAVRLRALGVNCEIIEKNDTYGGTWKENRYPGAGVDTPNYLYSFSFARHDWQHYFALQPELYDYFNAVAEQFNLPDITRFNTAVRRATYHADQQQWEIETMRADGEVDTCFANILLSAVGILNLPKTPAISGIGSFEGECFHTAEWPEGLALEGKRVAVVGNGATAMQVVPAIADSVASLTIFARSKQWTAPFPQFRKRVPPEIRYLLREVPLYAKWYRQRLAWTWNDRIHDSLQKDPGWPYPDRSLNAQNDSHRRFFTDYAKAELGKRQDLLQTMLPDYPPFGKRMLLDNGWYRTVARDHVNLIPERLKSVSGKILTDGAGREHEADILILATGFRGTEFLASFDVIGRSGERLRDVWDGDDARAYLGTTVPKFPNLFMLLGPNIGLGHGGSIISAIESQMDYVVSLVTHMFKESAGAIEVRSEACTRYNDAIDAAHERMVWTHEGMENWFRNSKGRVVALTPWRHDHFWKLTHEVDFAEYCLEPRNTFHRTSEEAL
jgi:4-hydroxyacetophenone monooxygenase